MPVTAFYARHLTPVAHMGLPVTSVLAGFDQLTAGPHLTWSVSHQRDCFSCAAATSSFAIGPKSRACEFR